MEWATTTTDYSSSIPVHRYIRLASSLLFRSKEDQKDDDEDTTHSLQTAVTRFDSYLLVLDFIHLFYGADHFVVCYVDRI